MGREQHPTIINISTHALREEGDVPQRGGHVLANISTHALREEGDAEPGTAGPANCNFYPRPPRGGRRALRKQPTQYCSISTHALREEGDTAHRCLSNLIALISTHALREEGDISVIGPGFLIAISTHALREEGDLWTCRKPNTRKNFYPRPPRGGRP